MKRLKAFFYVFSMFLVHLSFSQTSDFLTRQADGYLKNKQYFRAVELFRKLHGEQPTNLNIILKRVIAEYESNRLDSAEQLIKSLLSLNKNAPEAIFIYGKILMARGEFETAAQKLKSALPMISNEQKLKKQIVEDIKRCGVGAQIAAVPGSTFIESAGSEVNTIWDELNPIYSINQDSKFYFSSNRENPGTAGNANSDFELPFDMFATQLSNGEWSEIRALNPSLNTDKHDLLVDFNTNGQAVYYATGSKLTALELRVDTLTESKDQKTGKLDIRAWKPGDELYFFSDSFLLISSDRAGGYGGYDLYYSEKRNNIWSDFINLGSTINSPFDETSPYLAFDGRTLFFSCNGTNSIGGFDFFKSVFNDKQLVWSIPENLGTPINSPGDEKNFRLNKTRLSAIFTSNRKTGVGGYDIYFAYFRNTWVPQKERSRPVVFSMVGTPVETTLSILPKETKQAEDTLRIENQLYYYDNEDQISSSSFEKNVDKIVQILNQNQSLHVNIEVFTESGNKGGSEKYLQSILIADQLKQLIVNKGIRSSRIVIKGYGAMLPIAFESLNGKANASGVKMNNRIECSFFNPNPIPVYNIKKISHEVNKVMSTETLNNFRKTEVELNYKVLTISGAYASNLEKYILENSGLFFVEKNNTNGRYELLTKGYPDYESAFRVRKSYMAKGFEDAVIIPYFYNQRLQQNQLAKWAEKFPDLLKYIYRSE